MHVNYKKHINVDKNNRVEFLLINWDYVDGGDYLAKIFCTEFGMSADAKVDNIFFSIIKLSSDEGNYELMWHEDFGNIIYSIEQEEAVVDTLEQRLKVVLRILNEKLQSN